MKIKAMILAAGQGNRLRPITDKIPKPLLKVGGKTIIERHIKNLKKAGITSIIINVSHLADQIIQKIGDGSDYGLDINYSHEKDKPLETLGGILNAIDFFGDAEYLLVVNADIWCDYDFKQLTLPRKNFKAHLVLVPNQNIENPKGDFGIEGNIIKVNSNKKYTYSGISSIKLDSLRNLSVDYNKLGRLYRDWAVRRILSGEIYSGNWVDIGTHQRFEQANKLAKGYC